MATFDTGDRKKLELSYMISVIIPTYNRVEVLKICLDKLRTQEGVEFEIIVVDDGSTDETPHVISSTQNDIVRYIRQPKSQQGVARNRGVAEAKGELIVFIGDDIFVPPNFLKTHWEAHQRMSAENVVVLGYTTWDPLLEINNYMRFLENSGWQFGYGFLKPGFMERDDAYKFFYTSNISMKKSFFEQEKFNESFKGYGWEDIELGYRLAARHGMRLFYEPQARAYHHHLVPESDLPKKMQAVGRSARLFEELHPEVRVVPRGWKRLLIRLATNPLGLFFGRLIGGDFNYKLRSWREFFN